MLKVSISFIVTLYF